jgi:hypothetical protein
MAPAPIAWRAYSASGGPPPCPFTLSPCLGAAVGRLFSYCPSSPMERRYRSVTPTFAWPSARLTA